MGVVKERKGGRKEGRERRKELQMHLPCKLSQELEEGNKRIDSGLTTAVPLQKVSREEDSNTPRPTAG